MPEELRPIAILLIASMLITGLLLIAGYVVTRRTRDYLLYLGIGFVVSSIAGIIVFPVIRMGLIVLSIGAFILAVRASVRETRQRIVNMRVEEEKRSQAFGEYLEAITRGKSE